MYFVILLLTVALGLATFLWTLAIDARDHYKKFWLRANRERAEAWREREILQGQLATREGQLFAKDEAIKWLSSQLAMRGVKVIDFSGEPVATIAGKSAR